MPNAVVEGVLVGAGVEAANQSGITAENGCLMFKGRMLADATITMVACHELADGTHTLEVAIKRADHNGEHTCMITGEMLEDQKKINAMGTSVARCAFSFQTRDGSLSALKQYLQAQPGNNNIVVDVGLAGWNDRYGCWFGESGVIDSRGEFHAWRAGGIVCDTRVVRPYRHVPKHFNIRKDRFGTDIPAIEQPNGTGRVAHELKNGQLFLTLAATMPVLVEPTAVAADPSIDEHMAKARSELQTLLALWHRNTGNYAGAIALGYMASCAVRHHLVSDERNFPHLYISGRWGHGKDTMAEITALATGIPPNNVISAGKSTTEKLIRNKLAMVGNMPLWVNELRAENTDTLLTQIRTSYDLQGNGITNIKQEQVLFPVHRPFMLVGEVQVGRDAEFSRYVSINLKKPPAEKGVLQSLRIQAGAFSKHWTTFLRDHNRAAWQIQLAVEKLKVVFADNGADSRRARGWAIAAAGLAYLFDADCHLDPRASIPQAIFAEILERAADSMAAASEDGVGTQFWTVMQSLKAMGELSNSGAARWAKTLHQSTDKGTEKVAIWTGHLFRLLLKHDRGMTKGLIINELKADPGFHAISNAKIGGEDRSCFIFRLDRTRLPGWVIAAARQANTEGEADDKQEEPAADPTLF